MTGSEFNAYVSQLLKGETITLRIEELDDFEYRCSQTQTYIDVTLKGRVAEIVLVD